MKNHIFFLMPCGLSISAENKIELNIVEIAIFCEKAKKFVLQTFTESWKRSKVSDGIVAGEHKNCQLFACVAVRCILSPPALAQPSRSGL